MLKLLLVVAIFAAVTYLVTRMLQERGPGGGQPHGSQPRGPQPPRIPRPKLPPRPQRAVAPDDDEDFLRDLDRKRLKPPPDQDG